MKRLHLFLVGAVVAASGTAVALMRWPLFGPEPVGFHYLAKKGDREIALVPTIHAAPKPLSIPATVEALLNQAEALAVELDVTDRSLQQAAVMCVERAAGQLPRPRLTDPQEQELRKYLRNEGVEERLLENQSPYLLVHMAAQQQMKGWSFSNGLDQLLIKHMRARGRPVEALETTCSPLEALVSVAPLHMTPALLAENLANARSPKGLERAHLLLDAWERGDAALAERTLANLKDDGPLQSALAAAVQAQRDQVMAERLLKLADAHRRVVVAVGMQHISSPPGIPGVLATRGWDVRTVPHTP